jgi:hypothetical protein
MADQRSTEHLSYAAAKVERILPQGYNHPTALTSFYKIPALAVSTIALLGRYEMTTLPTLFELISLN